MIEGGCLCGAARYHSPGPVLFSIVCHCRDCQRVSGTGGVPVLGVPRTSFTSSGPIRQSNTRGGSGQVAVRNFCGECGSLLFGTPYAAPEMVTLYAGTLDDATLFEPSAALFVSHRPPWAKLAARLVEYAAHPDDA